MCFALGVPGGAPKPSRTCLSHHGCDVMPRCCCSISSTGQDALLGVDKGTRAGDVYSGIVGLCPLPL